MTDHLLGADPLAGRVDDVDKPGSNGQLKLEADEINAARFKSE